MANNPFCQEVVEHFPDPSSTNNLTSTFNLCCVKVVCATLHNDEFSHAENNHGATASTPSLIDTSSSFTSSSSSLEDDHDLIPSVSNSGGGNNNIAPNLNRDVPLDHGNREFEQSLLHIPDYDVPLDFGDYEHEQTEFHIPEKLSAQHDDKTGVIRFPTSSSSGSSTETLSDVKNEHKENNDGLNLEVLQVTQNSVQVRFPGITGGNLMYVEERLYRMGSRGGVGNSAHHSSVHLDHAHIHTPWENAIILEGNKIYTLTALKPGTLYRLRWQAPDKQYPDIMVSTQGKSLKNKLRCKREISIFSKKLHVR